MAEILVQYLSPSIGYLDQIPNSGSFVGQNENNLQLEKMKVLDFRSLIKIKRKAKSIKN